jgi:hypothetical protein
MPHAHVPAVRQRQGSSRRGARTCSATNAGPILGVTTPLAPRTCVEITNAGGCRRPSAECRCGPLSGSPHIAALMAAMGS